MKIGVLLPQSNMYPRLAQDFADGLRLITNQLPCELFIEGIHFGTNDQLIIEKSQGLILQHQVKLVVAFISLNQYVLESINNFFDVNRVPLLICDTGGNIPPNIDYSPYVLINSLQVWKSNWASGEYFAKKIGKELAISLSLHESGYNLDNVVRVGLEAEGGKNVISQLTTREIEMAQLEKVLENTEYKGLFVNYSGKEGDQFIEAYNQTHLKDKKPLFVNPIMTESSHLDSLEKAYSVHTWSEELDNPENNLFTTSFEDEYDTVPNSFALLGYEAGLIIKLVNDLKTKQIKELFAQLEIDTPRGTLKHSPSNNSLDAPIYLRQIQKKDSYQNIVLEILEEPKDMKEKVPPILSSTLSGWTNPYLCA